MKYLLMSLFYTLLSILNGFMYLETGIVIALITQVICLMVAFTSAAKWRKNH